ncbi:MAG: NADH-quinone oxidoreductase subunit J [Candidatus Rokuibacteriota bacterium]|jgi:NADH-quinone oxidoreductase subunit J|nr:MAG: NADH-quinone oxidoreductase subunit J [Candidatus Rokubacteria bacterium]
MGTVAFVLIAGIAVGSALGLVFKRNPIHAALFLVVNLGAVAVLYLTLGAEFLAVAQIAVYAGAIMVLFLFAIFVLIPAREETTPDPRRSYRILALPVGAALLGVLGFVVAASVRAQAPPAPAAPDGVEAIARLLFTDYLFPFEVTSVLLLAAMVGALLLSRRREG